MGARWARDGTGPRLCRENRPRAKATVVYVDLGVSAGMRRRTERAERSRLADELRWPEGQRLLVENIIVPDIEDDIEAVGLPAVWARFKAMIARRRAVRAINPIGRFHFVLTL